MGCVLPVRLAVDRDRERTHPKICDRSKILSGGLFHRTCVLCAFVAWPGSARQHPPAGRNGDFLMPRQAEGSYS